MSAIFTRLRHPKRGSQDDFDRGLIAPMILGSVLNPVNSSMIAVALIPIGVAFGAPPSETALLVSALYLATAIGQPVVGRLIDIYGARPLYLVGSALIGVAGVLGALAPTLGVLVVARVLIGLGTCAGYPAAMNLIRGESRRTGQDSTGGILTTLSVSTQTVVVVGPTLGGVLIGLGGWRAIFTVNVPLALACLVLGALRLPKTLAPRREEDVRLTSALDLAGIVLFAGTLISLLLFLMDPRLDHWYLLVITAAAAAGLTMWELRVAERAAERIAESVAQPFIDLRVLAGNLPLLATFARMMLSAIVSYSFIYGYTQWLEHGHGLSATVAGLVLLPVFATGIIVSIISGRRPEFRARLLTGAVSLVVACAVLLLVYSESAIWLLVVVGFVFGIPQGLNNLANQNALYYQADPDRVGSSAGLLRTFFYLGAIIASAAIGTFLGHGANTSGLHHLALFMLVIAALLLLTTLLDRSLRRIGSRDDSSNEPQEQ